MISQIIKFQHFFDEKGIALLQSEFVGLDTFNKPKQIIKPIKTLTIEVPDIFVYYDDPNLSSQVTVVREFEKDFLIPSISVLAEKYYAELIRLSEEKGVYTKEQREGFVKGYLTNVRFFRSKIKDASVLVQETLDLVIDQLEILETKMDMFIENPYPQIKNKMQFNSNQIDVINFFYNLIVEKRIKDMPDADLGRIIDNTCEYKENGTASYLSISDSRKKLNDLRNEARTSKKSSKRLKGH